MICQLYGAQGFTQLWDADDDKTITKKDAALTYLDYELVSADGGGVMLFSYTEGIINLHFS